jgi:hypothetical protein
MPEHRPSSSARLVAPMALVAFAVAFFAILLASGGGDSGGKTSEKPVARTTT